MADPRIEDIRARKANLSDLMVARSKASLGEKVNFCPFGCADEQIDDKGYCPHLVGFTTDGKAMEPVVQMTPDFEGASTYVAVLGSRRELVRKDDELVRITVSSRVYRKVAIEAKAKV